MQGLGFRLSISLRPAPAAALCLPALAYLDLQFRAICTRAPETDPRPYPESGMIWGYFARERVNRYSMVVKDPDPAATALAACFSFLLG